jgi:LPXTG-site transpeptidase (sortase) family protein
MTPQPPQRDPRTADAPPPDRDNGSRVLRWAAAATLVGAFLVYHSIGSAGSDVAVGAPTAPAAASAPPAVPAATTAPPATTLALPPSEPTRISVPTIGVNAPFTPLSMDAAGVLQPPPDTDQNLAGWYKGGATPGERGNAIVAGHVDTRTGPAVFFLLSYLKKGDKIDITRADGTVATFQVDEVDTFSKGAFPDQRVYGDTPDAQLRIITCGGVFDHKKQDYESNVVVFAHLASSRTV